MEAWAHTGPWGREFTVEGPIPPCEAYLGNLAADDLRQRELHGIVLAENQTLAEIEWPSIFHPEKKMGLRVVNLIKPGSATKALNSKPSLVNPKPQGRR